MRRLIPATAALLLLAPGSAAGAEPCQGANRQTMAATDAVRVYRVTRGAHRLSVYACLRASGRRTFLWYHGDDFTERYFVAPVRIAGTLVAYGEGTVGRPHYNETAVAVVDARSGRRVYSQRELGATEIRGLELLPGGAVAWIAEDGEGRHPVRRRDSRGTVTLDPGDGVDPGSLALSGSQLRWVRDGEPHTAELLDGPGCKAGEPAKTKLAGERVRVYKVRGVRRAGNVFACSYATGARLPLGDEYSITPDRAFIAPVRIAGDLAAYGSYCICRTQHGAVVSVVDPSTRRRLVDHFEIDWYRTSDLMLRGDGAVAAIAVRWAGGFDVWKHDGGGAGVLDSGPGIEWQSLELDGDTVSWVRDGERREAQLAPAS